MINAQSYQGIERSEHPDWFGWVVIDIINSNKGTKEDLSEIMIQLDYEVRLFNYEQNKNI